MLYIKHQSLMWYHFSEVYIHSSDNIHDIKKSKRSKESSSLDSPIRPFIFGVIILFFKNLNILTAQSFHCDTHYKRIFR